MSMRLPYFKSYDIRGTVPDQVNAEAVYRIGRDARLSSPSLAESMMAGLLDGGVTVLDTGMVTTPMLNYAGATA